MPAKRGAKKSKKIKRQPPEPMPSLIFNEVTLENKIEPENKPVGAKQPRRATYDYRANRLLWLGVIIMAAVIIFFWGYSLKLKMTNISWSRSAESRLIDKTKTNWDAAFAEQKNQVDEQKKVLEQVKNAIIQNYAR